MKTLTLVPKQCFIIFIIIADSMHFIMCLNMWTSLEQRQAGNNTPVKKCVSPCRIFHTWCKNDGKCREKGRDCTWYCECPSNCEGFFCEKIVTKESADTDQRVEVKVTYEKEKKKSVSAFDKSKLAQALAGIFLKEKQTDEEKKTDLPDTIERVGKTIDTKENVTTNIILNCPPGELPPKLPFNQSADITANASTSKTNVSKNYSELESSVDTSTMENSTTNVTEHSPAVTSSHVQPDSTPSAAAPIVKSSFSVTQTSTEPNNADGISTTNISPTTSHIKSINASSQTTHGVPTGYSTTPSLTTLTTLQTHSSTVSTTPSSPSPVSAASSSKQTQTETTATSTINKTFNTDTTNQNIDKNVIPPEENSLYIKEENIVETKAQPDLLKIIEKAIEVQPNTITQSYRTVSETPQTTKTAFFHTETTTGIAKEHINTTVTLMEIKPFSATEEPNTPKDQQNVSESEFINKTSFSGVRQEKLLDSANEEKSNNETTTVVNQEKNISVGNLNKDNDGTMSTERKNITVSPTTRMSIDGIIPQEKTYNKNVDLDVTKAATEHHIKPVPSNEMNLTDNEAKTPRTTKAYATSTPRQVTPHQTTSTITTAKDKHPIDDQKQRNVTTTPFTVTPSKTDFVSTTKPVTESTETITNSHSISAPRKMTTNKSKNDSNISKQTSTESFGTNRSSSENIVTGDINTLSGTNGQPLNMTGAIIMRHDFPGQINQSMSALQPNLSILTTTTQPIPRNATINVKVANTRPPSKLNNLSSLGHSNSRRDRLVSTETPSTRTSDMGINTAARQVENTTIFFTDTTKDPRSLKNNEHVSVSKVTMKMPVHDNANGNSDDFKQTLVRDLPNDNHINTAFETTSNNPSSTSRTNETSTKQTYTRGTTLVTKADQIRVRSSPTSAIVSSQQERIISTARPTTQIGADQDVAVERTTISTKTSATTQVIANSTTDVTAQILSTDTSKQNSTEPNGDGVKEKHVENSPGISAEEDTRKLTDGGNREHTENIISTTEAPVTDAETTKSYIERNVLTTSNAIYIADASATEESKLSLAKAFLDNQSDLLKQSKVKNEILSNKLSESVKDLKFDLLKMKLQGKGLPSDLDNIL